MDHTSISLCALALLPCTEKIFAAICRSMVSLKAQSGAASGDLKAKKLSSGPGRCPNVQPTCSQANINHLLDVMASQHTPLKPCMHCAKPLAIFRRIHCPDSGLLPDSTLPVLFYHYFLGLMGETSMQHCRNSISRHRLRPIAAEMPVQPFFSMESQKRLKTQLLRRKFAYLGVWELQLQQLRQLLVGCGGSCGHHKRACNMHTYRTVLISSRLTSYDSNSPKPA